MTSTLRIYNDHFGLTERPFTLLPDPDFLYWSESHTRAYTMLEYGMLTHAPITVITGEIGAGKTTLLRHLLRSLPEEFTVGLISNAQGNRGELLHWVLMALGVPTTSDATYVQLFAKFQDFLIEEYASGRRTMLIFDEAQNLSTETLEELRMFSNINADKDELLQLVLVGQPELRDLIAQPRLAQFAQRVAAEYHLPGMSAGVGRRLHRPPPEGRWRGTRDLHARRLRVRASRLAWHPAPRQPDSATTRSSTPSPTASTRSTPASSSRSSPTGECTATSRWWRAERPGPRDAQETRPMANLDLKYYWAVFKRRLPYFLVIVTLLAAIGITVASILPPVYQSSASLLAEPQQIPGSLAESTAEINPFEQIQIVEQRIMTRANLYDLAQRIGLYADQPDLSVGDIIGDMRDRIEFIGFEPDPTVRPGTPGAIIVGVSFDGADPAVRRQGRQRARVADPPGERAHAHGPGERHPRLLPGRGRAALGRPRRAVEEDRRLQDRERHGAPRQHGQPPCPAGARGAAPARPPARGVGAEEPARHRWSGSSSAPAAPPNVALSPEEEELQKLQSQLLQQQAIYKAGSPQIRVLQTRIAALQSLVAEQQAARAVPGADGQAAQPLSELEVELAPIDEQLKYIADERAGVEQTLADLAASLQATPENEMTLADLERELANLQTQYDNAVAALGQAQVTEKIEVLSKGQRFTLIEAPIEKNTPVSPPRLLIASAGIVGGLGAAVGFIVLWEMLNRSIRRPVELSPAASASSRSPPSPTCGRRASSGASARWSSPSSR